jgi:hypothetical protein
MRPGRNQMQMLVSANKTRPEISDGRCKKFPFIKELKLALWLQEVSNPSF